MAASGTMAIVLNPCHCSSGRSFAGCCGPLLDGLLAAPTAERLMRSRFTAFTLQDSSYLLTTWHPSTRPPTIPLDQDVAWLSLEIIGRTGGSVLVNKGTVEFTARYRMASGATGEQHENSSFVREHGRWYYLGAA